MREVFEGWPDIKGDGGSGCIEQVPEGWGGNGLGDGGTKI